MNCKLIQIICYASFEVAFSYISYQWIPWSEQLNQGLFRMLCFLETIKGVLKWSRNKYHISLIFFIFRNVYGLQNHWFLLLWSIFVVWSWIVCLVGFHTAAHYIVLCMYFIHDDGILPSNSQFSLNFLSSFLICDRIERQVWKKTKYYMATPSIIMTTSLSS